MLLVYLLTAGRLYVQFILKDGKPVSSNVQVPAEVSTDGLVYKLGDFIPVRVNGQDLYQLKGYAFLSAQPETKNKISVVLVSPTQKLAFQTSTVQYPNMIESYPNYKPGMASAEFSMLLSKSVLKPGTYQVGILVEDAAGQNKSFVLTPAKIQKTPNNLRYLPGQ